MALLFGMDVKTIGKHINNALKEELAGESVVAKFATPKKYGRYDGFEQIQYPEYYSLEMITSVGFRVKSKNGVMFRRWANSVLKGYLIKGYAVKNNLLKERYDELSALVDTMGRTMQYLDTGDRDYILRKGEKIVALEVKSGAAKDISGLELFKKKYPDSICQAMVVGPDGFPLDLFFKLDLKKLFRK